MSTTWSGPGRALQFHLELFEKVDSIMRFLVAHDGVPFHSSIMPQALQQRLRLITASTGLEGDSTAYHKDDGDKVLDPDNFQKAASLLRAEWKALNQGETHYVSAPIMQAVESASKQLEPEALWDTDLPCPQGLIVFEKPWVHNDLHPVTGEIVSGLHMPVRAISWTVGEVMAPDGSGLKPGVCYTLYADKESFLEIYVSTYKKVIDPDEDLSELMEVSDQLRFWVTDTSGWSFGAEWNDGTYGEVVAVTRRFLLSYFRWTWQRILVPIAHTPTRSEKKWIAKIKGRPDDGYVKILRLRREIEHERKYGKDYVGIFDYQFMVRGHPRRQWYPSLGPARINGEFNPASHRQIWIEPHMKGDPDGPLVLGHNVTIAVR